MPTAHSSPARASLQILVTRAGTYPLSIIAGIVVARLLGPHDRGIFAFLLLPGTLLPAFLSLGFEAGVIYYLGSRKCRTADVVGSCIIVASLQGTVLAALVGLLWRFGALGSTGREVGVDLLWPTLAVLPLQTADFMLVRVLYGSSQFGLTNRLLVLRVLFTSLAVVGAVALGWGLRGAVWATAMSNAILATFVVTIVCVRTGRGSAWNGNLVAACYSYGLRAWPGQLAIAANHRLDWAVAGVVLSPGDLGNYTIAVRAAELVWQIPDALGMVLFNRIAAAPCTAEQLRLTGQVHRLTFLATTTAAVALGAAGTGLIPIVYGRGFAPAAGLLLVLLPGAVAMATPKAITKYFAGTGQAGRSSLIQAAGVGVAATAYVSLVWTYGVFGVALASTAGYVAAAVSAAWALRWAARRAGAAPPRLFALGRDDVAWAWGQMARAFRVREDALRTG